MADYTYATPSGKTYDEYMKDSEARATKRAQVYAEKANAQNESYKTATNAIYDNSIKAQEETAAYDTKKANTSYNAQFDANAASELARERHLKEQMANLGLTASGYNATNQTALAVARSNADAATRTARQQAVDSIAEELRRYKADTEAKRAATLAENDRDTATRIMDTEHALIQNSHNEAMDLVNRDDRLAEFQWTRETDEKDRAYQAERDAIADKQWADSFQYQKGRDAVADSQWQHEASERNRQYVDSHNSDIYGLMLDAYDAGNTALAEEYAKDLWQIDENGTIVPMVFDTASASEFVNEQIASERRAAAAEAAANSPYVKNSLGIPNAYMDYVQKAAELNDGTDEGKHRALGYMYTLAEAGNSSGLIDQDAFERMLRLAGLSYDDWTVYLKPEPIDISGRYTK